MLGFLHAGVDYIWQKCDTIQNSNTNCESEFWDLLQEITLSEISVLK